MTSTDWSPREGIAEAQAEAAAYAAALATPVATAVETPPPPALPEEPLVETGEDVPFVQAGRSWDLLAGVAVALLGIVVAAVVWFTGSDARAGQRGAGRRADALAEARQLALNLVSIDYRTLDRDLKRISDST